MRKDGQALVEFVVGLIAVLVLFAALIQLGLLANAHTEIMVKAREEAGVNVITPIVNMEPPDYIAAWQDGDDEISYSADDEMVLGSVGAAAGIADFSHPDDLGQRVGLNPVSAASVAPDLLMRNMQRGYESVTVPLLPAVRNLLYADEAIELECEVWLVSGENTY